MSTIRWLVAAILIAAIHGSVYLIRHGGEPVEVAPLGKDIHELPLRLKQWTGEAVKVDPLIFTSTGAEVAIDRVYRDTLRHTVTMHSAAWRNYGLDLPHIPTECLIASGFRISSSKNYAITLRDQSTITGRMLTAERSGVTAYVLYWYELGDLILLEGADMREAHWKLRDSATWPPLVKIMLQTSAPTPAVAEEQLQQMSVLVAEWLRAPSETAAPTAAGSQE